MTVTVVSTTVVLVPGTARWIVQGTPGKILERVIYTHQTGPDVPEAVLLERDPSGQDMVLRGVSDGVTTSITPVSGGAMIQAMGDSYGGVLLAQSAGDFAMTLQRVGFTPDVLPWRYAAGGSVDNVVQLHDGTVFFTERQFEGELTKTAAVVVLDGQSGSVRARVPITAIRRYEVVQLDCMTGYNQLSEGIGLEQFHALSIDEKYGVVTTDSDDYLSTVTPEPGCFEHWGWHRGHQQLLIVDKTGASTTVPLSEWDEVFNTGSAGVSVPLSSGPFADARGGFVIDQGGTPLIIGPGAGAPALPLASNAMLAMSGMYVVGTGESLTAYDSTTGAPAWSFASTAIPVATAGAGLIIRDNDRLSHLDQNGTPLETLPVALEDVGYWTMGRWRGRVSSTYAEVVGPRAERPLFAGSAGNLAGQGTSEPPRIHTYVPISQLSISPDPVIASSTYRGRLNDALRSAATALTRIESEAQLEKGFLRSTAAFTVDWLETESPAEAVAFIGHAISADDIVLETSVGLQFFDKDLIKRRGLLGYPFEVQWINPNPGRREETALWVDAVRTETKILFFASCFVDELFLSLWQVPADGAVIVPMSENTFVPLNGGAEAWLAIARDLARGKSAIQAVTAWNAQHPEFSYRVVGNTNASIAPN